MRLFAAVVPPAPALAELAAAVTELRALPGADRLRWTDPAGWHVALAFYGEVDEAAVPGLRERLGRAAGRHPGHGLRLAGGGRFGRRVLWAGVDGDTAVLARLADSALAAARHAGVPVAGRGAFRPHVTLARPRRPGADLARYAAGLAGFAGSPWRVTGVSLLRSHLPPGDAPGGQPRYETVARWPLGGR